MHLWPKVFRTSFNLHENIKENWKYNYEIETYLLPFTDKDTFLWFLNIIKYILLRISKLKKQNKNSVLTISCVDWTNFSNINSSSFPCVRCSKMHWKYLKYYKVKSDKSWLLSMYWIISILGNFKISLIHFPLAHFCLHVIHMKSDKINFLLCMRKLTYTKIEWLAQGHSYLIQKCD